jgi:hypothetical protein
MDDRHLMETLVPLAISVWIPIHQSLRDREARQRRIAQGLPVPPPTPRIWWFPVVLVGGIFVASIVSVAILTPLLTR